MLQNWVGNGIEIVSSLLPLSSIRLVNLVIFWKQDGKSRSIFKDKVTEKNEREFFLKPWKVKSNKRRETKLDKLEKEGGIIIKPNKYKIYIVKKVKNCQICNFQNYDCSTDPKKGGLKTIQDLWEILDLQPLFHNLLITSSNLIKDWYLSHIFLWWKRRYQDF